MTPEIPELTSTVFVFLSSQSPWFFVSGSLADPAPLLGSRMGTKVPSTKDPIILIANYTIGNLSEKAKNACH